MRSQIADSRGEVTFPGLREALAKNSGHVIRNEVTAGALGKDEEDSTIVAGNGLSEVRGGWSELRSQCTIATSVNLNISAPLAVRHLAKARSRFGMKAVIYATKITEDYRRSFASFWPGIFRVSCDNAKGFRRVSSW